jgi:hypothetical protein
MRGMLGRAPLRCNWILRCRERARVFGDARSRPVDGTSPWHLLTPKEANEKRTLVLPT